MAPRTDSRHNRIALQREIAAASAGRHSRDLACGACATVLVHAYWPRPEREASPSFTLLMCPQCGMRNRLPQLGRHDARSPGLACKAVSRIRGPKQCAVR